MRGELLSMRKLRPIQARERQDTPDFLSDKWIENEVVGCQFQDARHGKRLRQLLEQLSGKVGATTPWASQDWANTKAAYRFFGNDRISEANYPGRSLRIHAGEVRCQERLSDPCSSRHHRVFIQA